MRNPLNIFFAALAVASVLAIAACANGGPSLPQIQQAGQTLVTTIKTDAALYEAQHTVSAGDQANISLALNSLSAANVVLQSLTTTGTTASYIQTAQTVVAAAESVINSLPVGSLPAETVAEINNVAAIFQLAAGIAQQAIAAATALTTKNSGGIADLATGTYLAPGTVIDSKQIILTPGTYIAPGTNLATGPL